MSYLVDGNNVMGQRVGWHRDKAGARRRLMEELARFAKAARVTVAVVFDGAPEEHFPDGSSFMGVGVYYAERGRDADARIKSLVEDSRERRTLKVVTSDRALADYVRRCGAAVVRAGEFRRRLDDLVEKDRGGGAANSETAGREGVKASELDEWLSYFGVAAGDGDGPPAGEGAEPKESVGSRGTRGGTKRRRGGRGRRKL